MRYFKRRSRVDRIGFTNIAHGAAQRSSNAAAVAAPAAYGRQRQSSILPVAVLSLEGHTKI